jgi:hypothetical protein
MISQEPDPSDVIDDDDQYDPDYSAGWPEEEVTMSL